jgi:hypothetical protein
MLSDEFLKVIQADRAREIKAADRVRLLRPAEGDQGSGESRADAVRVDVRPSRRPAHAGTAATDPCV